MSTSETYDRVFDHGLLTKRTIHLLSISASNADRLCPAYGTEMCVNCPHEKLIPDTCPMRDMDFLMNKLPKIEGKMGRDKVSIYCCVCSQLCPCNRTLNFEEVAKDIDRYERRRVESQT